MLQIPVLFEDENLLVLDKPAGLVVAPTETQKVVTLAEIVSQKYSIDLERAGIVHRLDKDTSGILLVAKTTQALENLQSQFKERQVKKEYIALVHGTVEKEGVVKGAIERNPKNREKFIVLEGGKEAETAYLPLGYYHLSQEHFITIFEGFNKIQMRKLERSHYGYFSLLRCLPLTGRTHQIRVHLKYIGFPIAGDDRYAGRKTGRLDNRWCPRQFLHAAKLSFNHPVSGERMQFESRLPDDLQRVLSLLERID